MKTTTKVLTTVFLTFLGYSILAQNSIQLNIENVYDKELTTDKVVKNSITSNSQTFQLDATHRIEREGDETILLRQSESKSLKGKSSGQQMCRLNNLVLESLVNAEDEVLLMLTNKMR